MTQQYTVCAFCKVQHSDTITTPCCEAQANMQARELARQVEIDNGVSDIEQPTTGEGE